MPVRSIPTPVARPRPEPGGHPSDNKQVHYAREIAKTSERWRNRTTARIVGLVLDEFPTARKTKDKSKTDIAVDAVQATLTERELNEQVVKNGFKLARASLWEAGTRLYGASPSNNTREQ